MSVKKYPKIAISLLVGICGPARRLPCSRNAHLRGHLAPTMGCVLVRAECSIRFLGIENPPRPERKRATYQAVCRACGRGSLCDFVHADTCSHGRNLLTSLRHRHRRDSHRTLADSGCGKYRPGTPGVVSGARRFDHPRARTYSPWGWQEHLWGTGCFSWQSAWGPPRLSPRFWPVFCPIGPRTRLRLLLWEPRYMRMAPSGAMFFTILLAFVPTQVPLGILEGFPLCRSVSPGP